MELTLQTTMRPLEEQLEGLLKAIITARGLKRRNIESEIQVKSRSEDIEKELAALGFTVGV